MTDINTIPEPTNRDSSSYTALYYQLKALEKQTGANGFDTIQSNDGAKVGSWYLIVPEEDAIFTSLIENGNECTTALVGAANCSRIIAGVATPKGINITAINRKADGTAGTGFTTIHLTSGRVKAYRK